MYKQEKIWSIKYVCQNIAIVLKWIVSVLFFSINLMH